MRLADLHPRKFFLETWQQLDEEAAEERAARKNAGRGYDYRPLIAFSFGALFLTLMEYFGMGFDLKKGIDWLVDNDVLDQHGFFGKFDRFHPWWELTGHLYWAGWRVLGFLLLPIVVIKFSGQRVRDQYLSTTGFREHLWIYLLAFAVVLVLVVGVSFTEGFSSYYPFYRLSHRSWADFLIWELAYIAQFLSLEFFFRGWWLSSTKSSLGSSAIFAMVAPYVMIHFGKEFAETIGATIAGIVLGTLAMRTRSIWGGFLVHCLVAVSMDVAALLQTTGLPTIWWPDLP